MWKLVFIASVLFSAGIIGSDAELRPVCRKSEYLEGHWQRLQSLPPKTFNCNPQAESEGAVFTRRGTLNTTIPIHDGCECDKKLSSFAAQERLMYEWTPKDCDLPKWDAAAFCAALDDRTILFIGDSTMEQSAVTVMSTIASTGGQCAPQLRYGRSNTFVYDIKNIDRKWFHYYEESGSPGADIVVLAAGAWFEDTGDMYWALDSVNQTIRSMRSKEGGKEPPKIIWKTQNPGHVQCQAFYHPITHMEEQMLNLTLDPRGWKFRWELFPVFDDMARSFAKQEGWGVIDMSPLYLRPDAHIGRLGEFHKMGVAPMEKLDCLHYCLPGPVDLFSVLLLHALVEGL